MRDGIVVLSTVTALLGRDDLDRSHFQLSKNAIETKRKELESDNASVKKGDGERERERSASEGVKE